MRGLIPVFYPIAHKVSHLLPWVLSICTWSLLDLGLQLRDILSEQVREGKKDIDVMAWMSRAALEYIGQGGLGYSFDALDVTKVNKYNTAIKMLAYVHFNESEK